MPGVPRSKKEDNIVRKMHATQPLGLLRQLCTPIEQLKYGRSRRQSSLVSSVSASRSPYIQSTIDYWFHPHPLKHMSKIFISVPASIIKFCRTVIVRGGKLPHFICTDLVSWLVGLVKMTGRESRTAIWLYLQVVVARYNSPSTHNLTLFLSPFIFFSLLARSYTYTMIHL